MEEWLWRLWREEKEEGGGRRKKRKSRRFSCAAAAQFVLFYLVARAPCAALASLDGGHAIGRATALQDCWCGLHAPCAVQNDWSCAQGAGDTTGSKGKGVAVLVF